MTKEKLAKVFVVTLNPKYDIVTAVFSTRELAQQFIDSHKDYPYWRDAKVRTHPVDISEEEINQLWFTVTLKPHSIRADQEYDPWSSGRPKTKITLDKEGFGVITIPASNPAEAILLAYEKQAEVISKHQEEK